jgi:beta-phosphoglucomutase
MSLSGGLALVFDLDGVIVDSMPLHTEAWRAYLRRYGIECEDLERRMHGRRNDDIVRDFIGAHLSSKRPQRDAAASGFQALIGDATASCGLTPEEIFAHGAAKEALYREMTGPDLAAHLVPGILEFLARYGGAPMAVASNAEPANIDFVLDGAGIRHYFQVIVDGMQVPRPKPYPDVYRKAADELCVAPRNCIVFEDSPAGIQAARAAGARVVAIETHGKVDGADLELPHFGRPELDEWLSEQRPA